MSTADDVYTHANNDGTVTIRVTTDDHNGFTVIEKRLDAHNVNALINRLNDTTNLALYLKHEEPATG